MKASEPDPPQIIQYILVPSATQFMENQYVFLKGLDFSYVMKVQKHLSEVNELW